jgi:hypothetical protein
VADGTYKPTSGTERSVSFVVPAAVAVYGGFAGGETDLAQRNCAVNVTVLSGDIGTDDDAADNSYHVAVLSPGSRADGLTFAHGTADGVAADEQNGGGVVCTGGAIVIAGCTFGGNAASGMGGGLYSSRYRNVSIWNCSFVGNAASDGGAIYNGWYSSASIVNSTFARNVGLVSGNAIHNHDASTATVVNSILWDDTGPPAVTELANTTGSSSSVNWSCILGGHGGTGNTASDPLLADPANDNLHLLAGSPCIGTGHNASIPPGLTEDMDDETRIQQGVVDMGADETGLAGPVVPPTSVQVDMIVMSGDDLNLNGPAGRSLGITGIGTGGNPPDTLYAFRIGSDPNAGWLRHQANGGRIDAFPDGTAPEWHTADAWVLRLRGLQPDTDYTFTGCAKSTAGIETIGVELETYRTNIHCDVNRSGGEFPVTGLDWLLIRDAALYGNDLGVDVPWATDVQDNGATTLSDVQDTLDELRNP